jgi:hypothetical protein
VRERSRKSIKTYEGRFKRFYHLEVNKLFYLGLTDQVHLLRMCRYQSFSVIKYICFSLKMRRYAEMLYFMFALYRNHE